MHKEDIPASAGRSSFNLLDERKLFAALDLVPGMAILDLGCGLGNYAVAASRYVGGQGIVHALDLWEEGIRTLAERAETGRLANIRARVANAAGPLPLAEQSIDLCLMATVVHILVREAVIQKTLEEVRRVLKPEGIVAVVEFDKVDGPPGPPRSSRIAPSELDLLLAPCGFHCTACADVGATNYLSLFTRRS